MNEDNPPSVDGGNLLSGVNRLIIYSVYLCIMKYIITERQLKLISEQKMVVGSTDKGKLGDRTGKVNQITLESPIGNTGQYEKKIYYYTGKSLHKKCVNLVEIYNQKIEERKIREILIKSMGFTGPDKFIDYMIRMDKWIKTKSENFISKWWDSEPLYKKVRNKFWYYFYYGNSNGSNKLGHQYHSKKEIEFEPDEFIFIHEERANFKTQCFYPIYKPTIPDCLVAEVKLPPKKIKNKVNVLPQTEPNTTITPEKIISEPTFTKEKPSIIPTNFVVQWQENGKQKIKFYPDFNSWENFIDSIPNVPYISQNTQKDKSSAGITYGSNPANLKADGSYVSNNKLID